jgi:putative hydrolase of the HAD superfamily
VIVVARGRDDVTARTSDALQLRRRFAEARAVAVDFYGTLVVQESPLPDFWEFARDRGFRANSWLQQAFEPDAFDGQQTPTFDEHPSQNDWLVENWTRLARCAGACGSEASALVAEFVALRRTFTVRALPGAVEVVHRLRRSGRGIALCSNWEMPIEPYLRQAGLPRFDALVVSGAVGHRKPSGAMFAEACQQLGEGPDAVCFVGDNWRADIAGALHHGMLPVWVTGNPGPPRLPWLVLEVRSVADLPLGGRAEWRSRTPRPSSNTGDTAERRKDR